jgi:hypothetical protein
MRVYEEEMRDCDVTWPLTLVRFHSWAKSLRSNTPDFRCSGNSDRRYEFILIELCMTMIFMLQK